MLVLSQKPDGTIHIGDDITVTILRVKGQQVKVGIEAPPDVHVLRGTLCNEHVHVGANRCSAASRTNHHPLPRKPR